MYIVLYLEMLLKMGLNNNGHDERMQLTSIISNISKFSSLVYIHMYM